jgi:hypothetical protein
METKDIESQAWTGAIRLAGSILVLSVAFKNIGIDFTPVMQALTQRISQSIEHEGYEDLNNRLIEVERQAHESKEVKPE